MKLVGMNHVGIGSDFDGVQVVPADLKSVPNLTYKSDKEAFAVAEYSRETGHVDTEF